MIDGGRDDFGWLKVFSYAGLCQARRGFGQTDHESAAALCRKHFGERYHVRCGFYCLPCALRFLFSTHVAVCINVSLFLSMAQIQFGLPPAVAALREQQRIHHRKETEAAVKVSVSLVIEWLLYVQWPCDG